MTDKQIIEELFQVERAIARIRLAIGNEQNRYMSQLLEVICNVMDLDYNEVIGPSRQRGLADARFIFAYHARLKCTWIEIGNFLGGRDHSSAVYMRDRYLALYDSDPNFRQTADLISKYIKDGQE